MDRVAGEILGKRRHRFFEEKTDDPQLSYKRFRRWIYQRSLCVPPAASTPLAAGWRLDHSFELDDVCQRLDLDSSSNLLEPHQMKLNTYTASTLEDDRDETSTRRLIQEAGRVQPLLWRFVSGQQTQDPQTEWSKINLQPFSLLSEVPVSPHGKTVLKFAAPALTNDYYCDLLDVSCHGILALALGSSVYLWNLETRSLVGCLEPSLKQTQSVCCSVSSLSWSRDGRTLCLGTRRGDIQLWDVEQRQNLRFLTSHLTAVRALSWKQQLLSSGSVLGHVYHHDPRSPAPLLSQTNVEHLCSLRWSPSEHRLASGSTDGQLHIWGSDVTVLAKSCQPLVTMKQPTAVKAVGWCPWTTDVIATGGGWNDGKIRIWDTNSGSCMTSVDTHSQICALRWDDVNKGLVSGHGRPDHQVISWDWKPPSLELKFQLSGHSERVLHLALSPDGDKIFSAGADDFFMVWSL